MTSNVGVRDLSQDDQRNPSDHADWGPNTLLSKSQFCQWAGVSERTLGQWITDGTAPKRLLLGTSASSSRTASNGLRRATWPDT
jgi:hypothetical protein